MLIIAIPKSASTSLMAKLGELHDLTAVQDFSFRDNARPENVRFLHTEHSDIRELGKADVDRFNQERIFYKQHIFPSHNNRLLLQDVKKVVLLRDTTSVLEAYRRGALKKVHTLLEGFSIDMSLEEWMEKSEQTGLTADLDYFNNEWLKYSGDQNTLIINYSELVNTPEMVIHQIEAFFGLEMTTDKSFALPKKRYSRDTAPVIWLRGVKAEPRNAVVGLLDALGLKAFVKRVLNQIKFR